MRTYNLYLADIAGAVEKILEYTKDYDYRKFSGDTLRVDAVVRNLEVMGEAAKHIPKKKGTISRCGLARYGRNERHHHP